MFGLGDDPVGFQTVESADLATSQIHLPPREVGRDDILGQFLVDFLDVEGRLPDFPFQSLHFELVVAGIDLKEHVAGLHRLAGTAGFRLPPDTAGHLGGQRHLAERHDHAIDVNLDPSVHMLERSGPHGHSRSSLGHPAGGRLLAAEQYKRGGRSPEDQQRHYPTEQFPHEIHDAGHPV